MIGSNMISIKSAATTLLIFFWFNPALAQDVGACNYNESAIQSWKSLIHRQLHGNDPTNALRLGNLADNILDGQSSKVAEGLRETRADSILNLAGGPMTLLELAVASCQPVVAQQLIALGASVEGAGFSSPLVTAAAKGQDNLVNFLILRGALIDKPDGMGATALEAAVRQGKLEPVRTLLRYGSSVNRRQPNGSTVLDILNGATSPESKEIAAELQKFGAVSGTATSTEVKAR